MSDSLNRKRQIQKLEEDDDTQVYKKPWVGLTEERIREIWLKGKDHGDDWQDVLALARSFEAELKDKNA